jgi:HlyD family secretion protein
MSSEAPNRPYSRHPSVLWSRLRWRWPVLVWLALAGLAFWLYDQGGEFIRINGMVAVASGSVSPVERGRLESLHVREGDSVKVGDLLAKMDMRWIEEEIAIRKEEEVIRTEDAERQLLTAALRVEEELRDYRLSHAEAEAQIAVYETELERIERLIESGYATGDARREVLVELALLKQRRQAYPDMIDALEEQLANLTDLKDRVLSPASQDGSSAVLRLLEQRREEALLRAHRDGVVSQIRYQAGEVVDAGESLLTIVSREEPVRILAFMNESDTRPIAIGDAVEIGLATGGRRLAARVVNISPNVLALADRASPIPNRVVRGRRLELVPEESVDLDPGSSVIVYLPRGEMLWRSLFGGWQP